MIVYEADRLTPEQMNIIRRSVGWDALPNARLEQALHATVHSVLARQGDRPIGMARLIGDGLYYFLCDVAVVPDAQGQGVGRHLVQLLLQRARQSLPACPAEAETQARCTITLVSAHGKEPFYTALGFESLPTARAGQGMQLILTREPTAKPKESRECR